MLTFIKTTKLMRSFLICLVSYYGVSFVYKYYQHADVLIFTNFAQQHHVGPLLLMLSILIVFSGVAYLWLWHNGE